MKQLFLLLGCSYLFFKQQPYKLVIFNEKETVTMKSKLSSRSLYTSMPKPSTTQTCVAKGVAYMVI